MKLISKARFDALASYCRDPLAFALAAELAWLATADEQVLATLMIDLDGEFSAVVLARDLKERYRWVGATAFFATPIEALADLRLKVDALLPELDEQRGQGDEVGQPVDFFTPVGAVEELNPDFITLATSEGYSPARGVIEPMMRRYEDADGNFVQQFQTTGYDARIWELYLFAALGEAGYKLDRSFAAPDFVAKGLRGEFCVEATTINPSLVPGPAPATEDEWLTYARDYLPIRYAGPLTSKLAKHYWEQPHVAGKPLVLAIQDFHEPLSMTWSRSGLATYLYGYVHDPKREADGSLTIVATKVVSHRWGTKEVQSGFFGLPGAENVSAVFFNTSGTIAKFNRIGAMAGFGSEEVVLVRQGTAIDPDPDASEPEPFLHVVNKEYIENWMEGMDVYHNPDALHPLDPDMIPGACHHRLVEDGQVESFITQWQPLASVTSILVLHHERGVEDVADTGQDHGSATS
jgi:hypothetical protein